jgi:4'-phosphopantetheinyl transferase EntD
MIEDILPSCVVAVDTREDWLQTTLYPDEEIALGRAVEKRRREFVTARECARRALRRLGLPAQAIPTGAAGEPLWPRGVLGSITHCAGYRACALAHARDAVAIGIDAEPHEPLPDGVLDSVVRPEERGWLARSLRAQPEVHWDRLLFSAKEAVYKAWFPATGRRLEFEDALVTVDAARGVFHARLLVAEPLLAGRRLEGLDGRWLIGDGLVLTAVTVLTP